MRSEEAITFRAAGIAGPTEPRGHGKSGKLRILSLSVPAMQAAVPNTMEAAAPELTMAASAPVSEAMRFPTA